MARMPLLTAITALGLLLGLVVGGSNRSAEASPRAVEVYWATYCGGSVGWPVSKACVDTMPKDVIVYVGENYHWWCASIDRNLAYWVAPEDVFMVANSGVTVCESCWDS